MKTSIAVFSIVATLAVCTAAHATYLGNALQNNGNTDGDAALVVIGQYNATPGPTSIKSFPIGGTVTNVQVWDNQVQNFTAYLLQPAGVAGGFQQFKILDGQSFATTAPGGGGIETFSLSTPWAAQAGDLIGFWGRGPSYTSGGNDAPYQNDGTYTASQPTIGHTYTFGTYGAAANYNYLYNNNDPRDYAFGVNFTPVPEPSSFILCGLGAAGLFFAARRRRRKA